MKINKLIKYAIILLIPLLSFSAGSAPFADLIKKEYKLSADFNSTELSKTYFSFNKKYFLEINSARGMLPKTNPLYTEGYEEDDILIGTIDISGGGDIYYITLSGFPSYDITYRFYSAKRVKSNTDQKAFLEPDFYISAPSLIIPSNGNIYSYGHNDNYYSLKRKFIFKERKITELKQSFSYIGVASASLKEQTVYSEASLKTELFKISKGTPVTVVGIQNSEGEKQIYIIASEFGLVGYIGVEPSREETQFSGFYYNGD